MLRGALQDRQRLVPSLVTLGGPHPDFFSRPQRFFFGLQAVGCHTPIIQQEARRRKGIAGVGVQQWRQPFLALAEEPLCLTHPLPLPPPPPP